MAWVPERVWVEKFLAGVEKLARAVKSTLGPRGRNADAARRDLHVQVHGHGHPVAEQEAHEASAVARCEHQVDALGGGEAQVGLDAVVRGSATYNDGGYVEVDRIITEADGEVRTQTWNWTYISG